MRVQYSDVVLVSSTILELESGPYFQDSDADFYVRKRLAQNRTHQMQTQSGFIWK